MIVDHCGKFSFKTQYGMQDIVYLPFAVASTYMQSLVIRFMSLVSHTILWERYAAVASYFCNLTEFHNVETKISKSDGLSCSLFNLILV